MEASTEFEAQTIAAVLEDAGIKAQVFALGAALGMGMGPAFGRVLVQVGERDVEPARAALKDARFIGASVDWDSVDIDDSQAEVERPALPARFLARLGFLVALSLAAGGVLTAVFVLVRGFFR